jgi:hypothetical protein
MNEGVPHNFAENNNSSEESPNSEKTLEGENKLEEAVKSVRDEFPGAADIPVGDIVKKAGLTPDEEELLSTKLATIPDLETLQTAKRIEDRIRVAIVELTPEPEEIIF